MIVRVLLVLAFLMRTAHATPCDPAEAATLREHLRVERHEAREWNLAWRVSFTVAALGSGAVAVSGSFPALRIGLYASATKATIGALARWIMPLTIHVPAPDADTCADLAALRKEVARVGKKERALFWTGHLGGMLVNLAGAAYIWKYDTGGKALLSIAVGYPVGLLSNYTMPRDSWHLYRRQSPEWTVTTVAALPLREGGGWMLGVAGLW